MAAQVEEKRNSYVNIKVISHQDDTHAFVKIRRSAKLKKMMEAYSKRKCADSNTFVFLLHGQKIHGNQTPDDLGLEDGVEIDAMVHQGGGG